MFPEESPETKYEQLQRRFQLEILSKYPNPERKGCPGDGVLKGLASRPINQLIEEDPSWQHVTHCSECYREFLGFQSAIAGQKKRQERLRWTLAGAALVLGLALFFLVRGSRQDGSKRPQNAELAYSPRIISIDSMTRSVNGGGEKKPFYLDRGRQALTVELPVGSRVGTYEFRLRNQGDLAILSESATATIEHGVTAFRVKVDLSGLRPGPYKIEVRQVPWDWGYYPVVLR